LENWFKLEFIFAKNLHIPPSELDQMEFYRIEYMLENYEEFLKEEEKQYNSKQKENEISFSKNKISSGNFKMTTPKINIPKIKPSNLNF